MTTPQLQDRSETETAAEGVPVLVATGPSPTGRRSVQGELVWFPPSCGRHRCTCTEDFTGATSHGLTEVALVTRLMSSRSEVRRALAAAMCADCGSPAFARAAADRLLDIAAALPEGALVHRTPSGEVVPLPPGSRPLPYGNEHARVPGGAR